MRRGPLSVALATLATRVSSMQSCSVSTAQRHLFVLCVRYPKVSAVFGGKTESSVICKNCQSVSRTVENYLDLSIPISAPKQTPANLASMDNNKSGKESPTLVRKNKKALKKEKKMQEARRKRELKPRSKLDLRTNKRRKKGGNLKNPRKAKPTKMNLTPAYTQKVSQTLKT
eukprot:m.297411 g.297411  ORF g.297411 m.297411 type:complete len:172 (+) comp16399_c1_seq8:220-735(+)